MRGNLVIGMIAGGIIGAAAAMITLPYFQPQINKVVKRGKKAIDAQMDKMTTDS